MEKDTSWGENSWCKMVVEKQMLRGWRVYELNMFTCNLTVNCCYWGSCDLLNCITPPAAPNEKQLLVTIQPWNVLVMVTIMEAISGFNSGSNSDDPEGLCIYFCWPSRTINPSFRGFGYSYGRQHSYVWYHSYLKQKALVLAAPMNYQHWKTLNSLGRNCVLTLKHTKLLLDN